MKYVITGSLGNISKPLAEVLLKEGHQVTIITSNPKHEDTIKAMGARPAVGTVEDRKFLNETFKDADAVYTMVPPKWDAGDWKGWIAGIGDNYVTAIKDAGIKYVVNLSSIGAHMPDGCGPVSGMHRVEEAMNALDGVHIMHLRPAYFYPNLLAQIPLIKRAGIMGANYGEIAFPMIHPEDIAKTAAEELLGLGFSGKLVRYLAADEKTGADIASAIGKAIGKDDLKWVIFSDEGTIEGMKGAGLSDEVSKQYTEMGAAMRTGEMSADYDQHKLPFSGSTFDDFVPKFKAAFYKS